MTAALAAIVLSNIVKVVTNLNEEDEQSTDNLNLIANIYDDIDVLVANGEINVTDSVRLNWQFIDLWCQFACYIVYRRYHSSSKWHI